MLTGTRRLVVVSWRFVATVRERFEAKVEDHDGHRVWKGSCDAAGTPQFRVDGRLTTARRVAWELDIGPVAAESLVIACPQVRGCVAVEHLQVVAKQMSVRRAQAGLAAAKPEPSPRNSACRSPSSSS